MKLEGSLLLPHQGYLVAGGDFSHITSNRSLLTSPSQIGGAGGPIPLTEPTLIKGLTVVRARENISGIDSIGVSLRRTNGKELLATHRKSKDRRRENYNLRGVR